MSLNILPDSLFEATFDSVYTGGAGQFRISIIDTPNDVVFLEPTTVNIFEVPPGSGIYAWSGRSPSTPGQYTIYWDDGNDPAEVYAVEDLIIAGIPPAGISQFTEPLPSGLRITNMRDVGPVSVPQDVKRLRREVGDMLRRYGQPVVHRHMYTLDDVASGEAKKCPACFDEAYSQVRQDCPVCHSIGFVSVENDPDQWISSTGELVTTETGHPAPMFGGFGVPTLTRIIAPDVPIDVFQINERGVLTRVQNSFAYTYWDPVFQDDDLIIMVDLAKDGFTVNGVGDHYQAKKATPNTVRGWGDKSNSRKDYVMSYQFEMALVPSNNVLKSVRPGPVAYGVL